MQAAAVATEDSFVERKRDLLILIMRFLNDHGYSSSYASLSKESSLSLFQMDAADNIDLMTIVQEYVEYYHSKYGRYPKLVRPAYADAAQVGVQKTTASVAAAVPSVPVPAVAHHPASYHTPTQTHSASPAAPARFYSQAVQSQSPQFLPALPPPLNWKPTTLLNSKEPITQEQFVSTLSVAPGSQPEQFFDFYRPRKSTTRRRSDHLSLQEAQEDLLYALVGCVGLGWSIKNVHPQTRDFLLQYYGISKDDIQLFFKNRAQKSKRARIDAPGLPALAEQGVLQGLQAHLQHFPLQMQLGAGTASPAPINIPLQVTSVPLPVASTAANTLSAMLPHQHQEQGMQTFAVTTADVSVLPDAPLQSTVDNQVPLVAALGAIPPTIASALSDPSVVGTADGLLDQIKAEEAQSGQAALLQT